MKKYIFTALSAFVLISATAQGQMWPLTEGTQEIQINGFMEWDGPGGDYTEIELGYGYFIDEGVEVGPRFAMVDQDGRSSSALDAYMEYHYPVADSVAPYAGCALGYISSDSAEDDAAATFTLAGGCKFFMVEDLALDIALNHTLATGDVFLKDNEYDNYRTSLSIGLRFFY